MRQAAAGGKRWCAGRPGALRPNTGSPPVHGSLACSEGRPLPGVPGAITSTLPGIVTHYRRHPFIAIPSTSAGDGLPAPVGGQAVGSFAINVCPSGNLKEVSARQLLCRLGAAAGSAIAPAPVPAEAQRRQLPLLVAMSAATANLRRCRWFALAGVTSAAAYNSFGF